MVYLQLSFCSFRFADWLLLHGFFKVAFHLAQPLDFAGLWQDLDFFSDYLTFVSEVIWHPEERMVDSVRCLHCYDLFTGWNHGETFGLTKKIFFSNSSTSLTVYSDVTLQRCCFLERRGCSLQHFSLQSFSNSANQRLTC